VRESKDGSLLEKSGEVGIVRERKDVSLLGKVGKWL